MWGFSWNNIELGLHEIIQPIPLESLAKDVQILQGDELLKFVEAISQDAYKCLNTKNTRKKTFIHSWQGKGYAHDVAVNV